MGAHVPRRRCVGCGRTAPQSELVRIALAERGPTAAAGRARRAVLDRERTLPGRGAYLCGDSTGEAPAADCLALAIRRGAIARALRCPATLPDELVELVS